MRGVLILFGIIAVSIIGCGVVPFMLMPGQGLAVALPVVSVPGEVLTENFLGTGLTVTNTIVGTLLADVLVLVFAFGAVRNLKAVPGRWQGLFEILTDALYSVAKSTAGANARKIFPLMATIFLFLLMANWLELIPGVDSIGLMHCADEGFSGYPTEGQRLYVDQAMDRGTKATEENYKLCHHGDEHHDVVHEITNDVVIQVAAVELGVESIAWNTDVGNQSTLADYIADQNEDPGAETAAAARPDEVVLDAVKVAAAEKLIDELEHAIEAGEITQEEADHALSHADETVDEALHATYYRDDLHIVTPFVRAAATDLNLTLGLGLFAFIAIQFFGVRALGIGYFAKFVNTPALENAGKNPGGLMDFGVGLLEIISELSKILSFGFRLFGNIFAGQILLFVITFLVATLLPMAIYGLELFVGLIQAFVFAMLVLVFSAMAMQGHGDHEHDEH